MKLSYSIMHRPDHHQSHIMAAHNAFFRRQAVAAGMNPMDLRKGIKLASDHVVTVLSDISKPISTKEEVAQVGTISANR